MRSQFLKPLGKWYRWYDFPADGTNMYASVRVRSCGEPRDKLSVRQDLVVLTMQAATSFRGRAGVQSPEDLLKHVPRNSELTIIRKDLVQSYSAAVLCPGWVAPAIAGLRGPSGNCFMTLSGNGTLGLRRKEMELCTPISETHGHSRLRACYQVNHSPS